MLEEVSRLLNTILAPDFISSRDIKGGALG
jgi:hypothetical protein